MLSGSLVEKNKVSVLVELGILVELGVHLVEKERVVSRQSFCP